MEQRGVVGFKARASAEYLRSNERTAKSARGERPTDELLQASIVSSSPLPFPSSLLSPLEFQQAPNTGSVWFLSVFYTYGINRIEVLGMDMLEKVLRIWACIGVWKTYSRSLLQHQFVRLLCCDDVLMLSAYCGEADDHTEVLASTVCLLSSWMRSVLVIAAACVGLCTLLVWDRALVSPSCCLLGGDLSTRSMSVLRDSVPKKNVVDAFHSCRCLVDDIRDQFLQVHEHVFN